MSSLFLLSCRVFWGKHPVLVDPKWPHHIIVFLHQPLSKSASSSCGTSGRTSLRTATTLFHCRPSPTRVLACEWGSVRLAPRWTPACLRHTHTHGSMLCITLQLRNWKHECVTGYSGLVLDSTRSNVFCNCTDDNIYMFNVSGVKTSPGKRWSQPEPVLFYSEHCKSGGSFKKLLGAFLSADSVVWSFSSWADTCSTVSSLP